MAIATDFLARDLEIEAANAAPESPSSISRTDPSGMVMLGIAGPFGSTPAYECR
ncbi:MAG: hypothetical protein AAGH60_13870 [Pseudomonadota bacterium]